MKFIRQNQHHVHLILEIFNLLTFHGTKSRADSGRKTLPKSAEDFTSKNIFHKQEEKVSMKENLLYSAWHYKMSIRYKVEEKVYYEYFDVITHKNYADIQKQLPEFIMRDVKHFFHDYAVVFISAEINIFEALNW